MLLSADQIDISKYIRWKESIQKANKRYREAHRDIVQKVSRDYYQRHKDDEEFKERQRLKAKKSYYKKKERLASLMMDN